MVPLKSIHLALVFMVFTGCAHSVLTREERVFVARTLAKEEKLNETPIRTSRFNLYTLQKISPLCKSLNVYIEGDGLAWKSRSLISDDPTPLNPIALSLMRHDTSSCKVYIARPCQYISSAFCHEKYWTSHRFSSEVIASFEEALDDLKKVHSIQRFNVIGYSGGGAVAALLASRREDIQFLLTVAGNLDTDFWTTMHDVEPLYGSLNPAKMLPKHRIVKQHHLIGINDVIVPKGVFFSYLKHASNPTSIGYSLHEASHSCCWEHVFGEYYKHHHEIFEP